MQDTEQKPVILIVDDTPANVALLANALSNEYKIKVATNGYDAIEIATKMEVDVILLDVMMPGLDGYEVCRQLKAINVVKDTPIIFITANDDAAKEEFGLQLGAVDYIIKPFQLPIVRARIKNHVELRKKSLMLEKLLMLDGLTGISNRRRFDEALLYEWARGSRTEIALGMIMIDVDQFKLYNDTYGHAQGDICLKSVATVLASATHRAGDVVARYGGEEFVVLLPGANIVGGAKFAERLRGLVFDLQMEHQQSTWGVVTISLGVASMVPSQITTPKALLENADKMLYEAKASGRNRVYS